ncbi:MAG: hypothetical protein P0119_02280 [Nitrospira sp.]|nr:hypothetical protein [Nitrospira sp.]
MDESQDAVPIGANETDRRGDQSSPLASRLIRRITQPIGVVDVRHPEEIYERTTTWLSKRFPLLESMMARCRNSDDVAFESSGSVLRMAGMDGAGNEEERVAPPPVTVLPRLTASSFSSPSGSVTGEPLPSSSPTLFRVSRRPHRGVAPSSASGTSKLSAETGEKMPRASHPVHRVEEKADLSVGSAMGGRSGASQPVTHRQGPVQLRESSNIRAAELLASDGGSAGTEERLVLQKAVPEQEQPRGDAGPAPPFTHHEKRSGPFVMTERVGGQVERMPWLSSRMQTSGQHSRVSPSSEEANVNPMVWKTRARSIENVEEALHNLNCRVMQRQEHEAGPAEAVPSLVTQAHTTPQSATSPQEAKVDIGALAETVSRVIARQLIAERERRGVDGWR